MPTPHPASPNNLKTVKPSGTRSALRGTGSTARTSRTTRAKTTRTRTRSVAPGPTADASRRFDAERPTGVFGEYAERAERAILIPVGAALIARERVVASVNGTISSYSSSSKARAQLRRFERRGATARNRLEREVRKTRVRVERELRQRRREVERTVSNLEDRRDTVTKSGTDLANRVPELANRVQERILSFV